MHYSIFVPANGTLLVCPISSVCYGRNFYKAILVTVFCGINKAIDLRRFPIHTDPQTASMERKKLEELFHRLDHPFPDLMIDRILEISKNKNVHTLKGITANEFYLSGHFPGNPIVPGVMTLEGMVQSALILVNELYSRGKVTCTLEKVDRLKFRRPVMPGDRIEFQVELKTQAEGLLKFKGKALVSSETATEADFVLKISVREVGFEL